MKNILVSLILICGVVFTSCENLQPIENGVFISEAQSTLGKKISIDNTGGSGFFTVRLGEAVDVDVTAELAVDAAVLDFYNAKNGTAYKLLPEAYYSLDSNKAVIKGGKITSEPVFITIEPLGGDISPDDVYAIPLSISSVTGGVNTLDGSKSIVLFLDEIVVTNVPYLSIGTFITADLSGGALELPQWTLEWNIYKDGFPANNCTQWVLQNDKNVSVVYTRFGDVVTPTPAYFQAKIGTSKHQGSSALTGKKWYHLALVYDGANILFYINGVLDVKASHPVGGEVFSVATVKFGNVKGQYGLNAELSELRLWSIARSQSEITNSMFKVHPKTEGLEIYWKMNEGEGKVFKDFTGNGRTGNLNNMPTWRSGVRFPEGK